MESEPEPTDPEREKELGRLALWLDPDDLRWLAVRCDCPPDASDEQNERCARVRFGRARRSTRRVWAGSTRLGQRPLAWGRFSRRESAQSRW